MQPKSWLAAAKKHVWMKHLFGRIVEPSTAALGVESWIASLRESRARETASLANGDLKTTNVICGPIVGESFAKWDQPSSSWRTFQACLFQKMSNPLPSAGYSESWVKWGSMRNGECFQRRPAVLPIFESACLFLPTLTAGDGDRGGNTRYTRGNPGISLALRMLPTLTASNTKGVHRRTGGRPSRNYLPTLTIHGNNNRREVGQDSGDGLATVLRNLPTLCARDYRTGPRMKTKGGRALNEVAADGGPLNPRWCEWFMGFPIGWTKFEPLEMRSYRQWQRSHSGLFGEESAVNAHDPGGP